MGIRIAVDRGGTFCDIIANSGSMDVGDDVVLKLLSVDPKNYPDAPLEGIRRVLETYRGTAIPRGSQLDLTGVDSVRMGTTVATNALLERKGERCALVTNKGFKDALEIGNQTRPDIFDLSIKRPGMLYETVVEIDARVTLEDYTEDPAQKKSSLGGTLVEGKSGEIVRILQHPNESEIRSVLNLVYATGIRSIAVALLHSYTYQDHEKLIGKIAKEIGFTHISLSCEVSPMIKFVPRAQSAIVDSYLTPQMTKYLEGFESGLISHTDTEIQFMQSDGGLSDAHNFTGINAILSGPAGGIIGAAVTCYNEQNKIPLILTDMGGTSFETARYDGRYEHVFEANMAGVTVQAPQLDIHTIAAGGSSMLLWKNGLMAVGPESAAADPGPACYKKGGPLAITDANLVLGRLVPGLFPKIFGPHENEALDVECSLRLFEEITATINSDTGSSMSVDEVAYGFIKVANETMARSIRALTESKGHIVSQHRLVSYGGAGGQHAVALAQTLGIETVLIHRYSSILSAYGIFLADVVVEEQEPCSFTLNNIKDEWLNNKFKSMCEKAGSQISSDEVVFERFLNLRYEGTESALMILEEGDFIETFTAQHKREFGFTLERNIIIDDIRVRAIGKSNVRSDESVDSQLEKLALTEIQDKPFSTQSAYFEGVGRCTIPIYKIEDVLPGTFVNGPSILADATQTNVILPNSRAIILKSHVIVQLNQSTSAVQQLSQATIDPVMLSIFGNRFMDIAEQMGNQLRKTSVSTNVKERLDFSCALFDPEGNLVANAPHVPVHLGSMSTCIAAQARLWKGKLKEGDVLVTNHPDVGGTHLPDITVITPAFSNGEIIFYVASRAHHSDIGSKRAGSMPPDSKALYEEGAVIYSELLVQEGVFNEKRMVQLLFEEPAKYPGCSGTRKLNDNISDLKAQIASNVKGIQLISRLVKEFGVQVIHKYMNAIQQNAAETVKGMLVKLKEHLGQDTFECEDFMDDGSRIKLKVTLNENGNVFDFTGTSPQMYGNLNAPIAITYSAILYCLRCMVNEAIPLNQGCLQPIEVIVPEGTFLRPRQGAAVVGGNVVTSQRITDVVLKTFKVMGDSQGDCNNLTFGIGGTNEKGEYEQGFGYYETICGGHGAGGDSWRGPGWNGVDAVHTNMTNTRMTDVEIFERRYPVILREFSIRRGSGGNGKYHGGNGVIRDIEFRIPVECSILSERRSIAPHGIEGGEDGLRGVNLWVRDDQEISIGGKNSFNAKAGDRIFIMTPGGGGFGRADE